MSELRENLDRIFLMQQVRILAANGKLTWRELPDGILELIAPFSREILVKAYLTGATKEDFIKEFAGGKRRD